MVVGVVVLQAVLVHVRVRMGLAAGVGVLVLVTLGELLRGKAPQSRYKGCAQRMAETWPVRAFSLVS